MSVSLSMSRSSVSSDLDYPGAMSRRSVKPPGLPVFTTRFAEKKARDTSTSKYVFENETGSTLHTTWYINDKGDKIWLRFDPSRPCTQFCTTETRFYKPKLHTYRPDPYEKKTRGH
eukprot:TRINITY_DN5350_c0_g1_i1.p1 TRINITY_DN5350_c0_g1~~TRINITY_DN5350_c0_g1_i1.p1  ORF type:complete len:116 (-),score=27.25 TRINITY_DN5350_c0_g1_i1:64-411(-)